MNLTRWRGNVNPGRSRSWSIPIVEGIGKSHQIEPKKWLVIYQGPASIPNNFSIQLVEVTGEQKFEGKVHKVAGYTIPSTVRRTFKRSKLIQMMTFLEKTRELFFPEEGTDASEE